MNESDGTLIWLYLLLVCGVVAAAAASARDRNIWMGYLIGVLFGPLGPIIVLLWPEPQALTEPPPPSREDEIVELLTRIRAELKWQREQSPKPSKPENSDGK